MRYNDGMFKPTTQSHYGYRRQYNPKLRESIAKFRPVARAKSHAGLVTFMILLVAIIVVAIGSFMYVKRTEPEAVAKPADSSDQTNNVVGSLADNSNTPVVIPYNTTIGFVGDSLTYGCCTGATPAPTTEAKLLGDNYRAINRGVNGSTTGDWLDHLLAPALDEFKDNDVEIVQVMLGTNDIAQSVPTDQIVDNLNQIAGRLLDNGAKVIIINRIPYSSKHNDIAVQQLNVAISELPNGQNVYLGDSQAYDYFRQNQDQLYDGIHMNQEGYDKLAEFWVDAFKRIVVEPSRTSRALSIGDYSKGSGDDLTYSVDKSTSWFVASMADKSGVLIDGQTLSQDAYSVTSGEKTTAVTIHADYLKGLSNGNHVVAIRFIDGVVIDDDFTVSD